jgi:hypothetical protein
LKLRERFVVLAGLVLVIAAGAGGALLGVRLGHAASEPSWQRLAIPDPGAATDAADGVARSPGGFTGFGGRPALRGEVLRSGRIQTVTTGAIEIASPESGATIRYTTPERLYRIAVISAPLRAGDLVQVHVKDGAVTATLRLPPGLDEGINRGP